LNNYLTLSCLKALTNATPACIITAGARETPWSNLQTIIDERITDALHVWLQPLLDDHDLSDSQRAQVWAFAAPKNPGAAPRRPGGRVARPAAASAGLRDGAVTVGDSRDPLSHHKKE
jgi:hypothetical protein